MSSDLRTFRDPILSLFQSAVSEIGRAIDAKPQTDRFLRKSAEAELAAVAADIAEREHDGSIPSTPAPRDLSKSGIARECAEHALRYLKALARRDTEALAALANEFTMGTCDPAWLSTLKEYDKYFDKSGNRKSAPYVRPSDAGAGIIQIPSNARLALVGDWGTGAPPAAELLKLIAADKPDIFVHLGDIYYSGTPDECQRNFADLIRDVLRAERQTHVFTLSGNHDMYCGGVGFYDLIKNLNERPFIQPASFFCLRTADEKWQLLAMDTGLHDDNPSGVHSVETFLESDEIDWHCERIREFPGKTILLSHHQLFSAFSPMGKTTIEGDRSAINPLLMASFERMSSCGTISAWFWGHEHSLSIYQPFAGLQRGRCIGHGAIPVSLADNIYEPVKGLSNLPSLIEGTKLISHGNVYTHGYALLSLGGSKCHVDYIEHRPTGRYEVFSEVID